MGSINEVTIRKVDNGFIVYDNGFNRQLGNIEPSSGVKVFETHQALSDYLTKVFGDEK